MTGVPEPLLLSVADGVATLLLNRPEKRNALNAALVEALLAALEHTAADPAVRVVVVRGAGFDFCAGGDLEELGRMSGLSEAENLADARRLGGLFLALRRHPRPVVAIVRGRALAGGAGLATACDLVLAHEQAELGYPEVQLGFVSAIVMTILRRKVTEAVAFELVTRGERITAADAARAGLVNRVLPDADFEAAADRYVAELAARPPSAVALSKRLLYELDDLAFDEGIERGARVNVEARMTEACREGVRRFLERPRSGGEPARPDPHRCVSLMFITPLPEALAQPSGVADSALRHGGDPGAGRDGGRAALADQRGDRCARGGIPAAAARPAGDPE